MIDIPHVVNYNNLVNKLFPKVLTKNQALAEGIIC